MAEALYQIKLPYATAGIVVDVDTGKVVEAAPIFLWMLGKPLEPRIKNWVQHKSGSILKVGDGK
jgi:hypothetical protein